MKFQTLYFLNEKKVRELNITTISKELSFVRGYLSYLRVEDKDFNRWAEIYNFLRNELKLKIERRHKKC